MGVVKPTLGDLLPFKLGRVMLALGQSLPAMCRDAIEHWKERRKEKLEDEALSDSEDENEENGVWVFVCFCFVVCLFVVVVFYLFIYLFFFWGGGGRRGSAR